MDCSRIRERLDLSEGQAECHPLNGRFEQDLEERLLEYFTAQKRFSTIVKRSVVWSLIDFPIILMNWSFIVAGWLFHFLTLLFPSSDWYKDCARWCRVRKSRSGWFTRLLPPYRTKSAQSKLIDFKHMVIAPLEKAYPLQVRELDFDKIEEALIEALSSWEKIPNIIEYVLTPICWLQGISFLGLDPKTVIIKSRDKALWHYWEELGQSWFGKIYLRIKWLFDDTIPWTYSLKFIAIGLLAYIVLMVVIEFISVRVLYREGAVKRLLENVALHHNRCIDQKEESDSSGQEFVT